MNAVQESAQESLKNSAHAGQQISHVLLIPTAVPEYVTKESVSVLSLKVNVFHQLTAAVVIVTKENVLNKICVLSGFF